MSMRHMEEELRHSNELNTVQQAELKTLRQRQSETRALVGVQSAEDETAGDWEEKILELAEAEYTIDQLTQRRKTDYKKIKMLQAKVTALETYSQERGEILTHSADLHSKLKSVKGQLAQKGKSLELKAAELARVNATLEELRCKAAGAETERSELAQALVLNTRLQAKLKKTTALLENARQRPPATTVGADQAGVGQLGEFKDLHTELQSFLTLLEAGN
jgi:chromosome segregation ATPase